MWNGVGGHSIFESGDNPARPSIWTACDPATDLTSQNDPQMMHVDYELACVGELGIQDA